MCVCLYIYIYIIHLYIYMKIEARLRFFSNRFGHVLVLAQKIRGPFCPGCDFLHLGRERSSGVAGRICPNDLWP